MTPVTIENKNVKFVLKCILALLPIIIFIGFIALCPDCYMDEEYPAWKFTKDYVRGRSVSNEIGDADILILGDSRAMADLIPSVLEKPDENCVNIAVGGATPMEMYYFYVSYLKNYRAPKTAIVMFAPFHYTYMDNYKTRTLYFNALSGSDYNELMKVAMRFESDSVLFENQAAYHLSCAMRLPDVYLPAIYNARFTGRKSYNVASYNNYIVTKGQGYFGLDDGNSGKAYEASYAEMEKSGDANLLEFYASALYTLLSNSCQKVILVQPPFNEATYDALDPGYIDEYKDYIDNLCGDFDNMIFSSDFVRYDNKYFGDDSHLNEKGATKYSEEFKDKYLVE